MRLIADLDPGTRSVLPNGRSRSAWSGLACRRRVVYQPAEPAWWAPRAVDHFTPKALERAQALWAAVRMVIQLCWSGCCCGSSSRRRHRLPGIMTVNCWRASTRSRPPSTRSSCCSCGRAQAGSRRPARSGWPRAPSPMTVSGCGWICSSARRLQAHEAMDHEDARGMPLKSAIEPEPQPQSDRRETAGECRMGIPNQ